MAGDIHRRLAALETRRYMGAPKFQVWVNEGDGLLRSREGRVMTQEAFDKAFPNARKMKLNIFEKSDRR
jgi:hypothetical protein